jgi:alkylhydroperoxidase family enzyme
MAEMNPIFLDDVERTAKAGSAGEQFAALEAEGIPVPQILYLFAYKPRMTEHLSRFTQELMRGPSPLSPGQRELIAAFTSRRNQCPF